MYLDVQVMDKLYTIQEVAAKLGLSDKTLRRWEEAGRFTPSRTLGNQRRYSLEDLQILDAIKHGTINEQKDLLTAQQASQLCGVSSTTILRWENGGKIHPLITSGNTYYPRQKLIEKMDELKKIYAEQEPISLPPVPIGARPVSPAINQDTPKLTTLDTRARRSSPLQFNLYLTNALITFIIIIFYHLLFNQSSAPISPQVQGASISTVDPRVDDLLTKFQDHLSSELLKDAKPIKATTINLDNTSLIAGTATLPKGKNQISVTNDKITAESVITATFISDFSPAKKYWVTPGTASFTLYTDFPVGADSPFNYSLMTDTNLPVQASTTSAIIKP